MPWTINQNFEGVTERDVLSPSLTWSQFGDDVDFTSITAYTQWDLLETSDFDFSPFDAVRRATMEDQKYISQELRLASSAEAPVELSEDVSLRWLTGLQFYFTDTGRSASNDLRAGFPLLGVDTSSGSFEDVSVGLYGETTLSPGEDVDLTAGVRYDHDFVQADLRNTFVSGGATLVDQRSSGTADFGQVLPFVGASWRVIEEASLYANVGKGYKAGGFNLRSPSGNQTFEPERSWSYELGVKSSLADGKVNLRAAGFYIDWQDMQLTLFDPVAGGYVANAGESTSHGFELEASAQVTEGVSVFAGVGTADTSFDRFVDPFGNDVSGNSLPFAPENTWSVGSQVGGDIAKDTGWFARAEYVGVGTFYYDANNTQMESYQLLNLRGGLTHRDWSLSIWTRNLLDEAYFPVAFQPDPTDPTVFVAESGEPMVFGVSLTASF